MPNQLEEAEAVNYLSSSNNEVIWCVHSLPVSLIPLCSPTHVQCKPGVPTTQLCLQAKKNVQTKLLYLYSARGMTFVAAMQITLFENAVKRITIIAEMM